MLKTIVLGLALIAPSLAFADVVIRVDGPRIATFTEYQPHEYRSQRRDQRQLVRWIDDEQARQRDRLTQGVRSGELTPPEAYRLREEQSRIQALQNRSVRDGYLSRNEFDAIQDALRASSRHIAAQKHDRQDRDDHYGYGYGRR